jgi:hypothetical protein
VATETTLPPYVRQPASSTTVFYVDSGLSGLVDCLIVEHGMDKATQGDTGRLMYLLSGDRMTLEVQPPSYTGSAQVSCRGSHKEELADWVREYFGRSKKD